MKNGLRLLLVEDEAIIAMAERIQLEREGYTVETAASGQAAIEAFKGGAFDIVLLDIDLGPGIDGAETAQRMLALREVPIVFLSSHTEDDVLRRMEGISSYGFVAKSSERSVLFASIRMALRLFEARRKAIEHDVNEARLRFFFDNTNIGVIFHGPDRSIEYANEAAARILGLSRKQLLGLDSLDPRWRSIHEDGSPFPGETHPAMRSFDTGESYRDVLMGVYSPLRDDTIWISIASMPIIGSRGNVDQVVVSFEDVTARKKAEDALRESEGKLKALFSSMTEMVAIHELILDEAGRPIDYRIIDCNAAYSTITGIAREVAAGSLASKLYGTDPAPYLERYAEVALTGRPYSFVTFYEPMGKWFSISVVSPAPKRFATVTSDITPVKKAEEELKLFKESLENATDAVGMATAEGRHFYQNKAFTELFGDVGKNPLDSYIDKAVGEEVFATIMAGGSWSGEVKMRGRNGRALDISLRAYANKDELGRVRSLVGMHTDITERKAAEAERARQLEEKEILLRETHHRIKNNIASIASLLSLQAGSAKTKETADALNEALGRVKSMQELYEKMLMQGEYRAIDAADYLSGVADSVVELFAGPAAVSLVKDLERFDLDAKRIFPLGIIVNELITNSMKYAFEGRDSGNVKVSSKRDGEKILIEVADDGIGMDASKSGKVAGGFGLTLVRMLAEQLGAEMATESLRGYRVSLRFTL